MGSVSRGSADIVLTKKLIHAHRNPPLRAGHRDLVTRLLRAREDNLAVPLLLQFLNLGQTGKELTMVQSVDIDNLRGKLRVLSGTSVRGEF